VSAGRPISEFDLPEGWQNTILEMYKEGASDVEVKAVIYELRGSFSNDLWERWMEEEDEFSETIKVGKMLSAAWWQKSGRTNLKSNDFNYTGWYMNMKNRFGWRDKVETEHSGSIDTRPIQYSPQSGNEPIKD
jgi:hypothetical protein